MARVRTIIGLLAALAIGGCATTYALPVVEDQVPFDGLRAIILTSPSHRLRVFWTHGMCRHDASWYETRDATLRRALGAGGHSDIKRDMRSDFLYDSTIKQGNDTYKIGYFLWSSMTEAAKLALAADQPPAFGYKRANLNNSLKTNLIDDCFSDAVAYLGKPGDKIRAEAKATVCEELGGRLTGSGVCDVEPSVEPTPTVLISESLGSKIMMDAIRSIWEAKIPPAARARLAEQIATISQVFLLSNQLPLLDVAKAGSGMARGSASSDANDLAALARIITDARSRSRRLFVMSGPLKVVSFDDPNDLLSYRLNKTNLGLPGASLVNVIVSNDVTYLGLLERPDTAHCGYAWNKSVTAMLVNGYDPIRGIRPVAAQAAKQSCL